MDRATILQRTLPHFTYCEKCFSVAGLIALGNLSGVVQLYLVVVLAAQNNNFTEAYFEEVQNLSSINPKNDIVI